VDDARCKDCGHYRQRGELKLVGDCPELGLDGVLGLQDACTEFVKYGALVKEEDWGRVAAKAGVPASE